jgi:hypothetical protein
LIDYYFSADLNAPRNENAAYALFSMVAFFSMVFVWAFPFISFWNVTKCLIQFLIASVAGRAGTTERALR